MEKPLTVSESRDRSVPETLERVISSIQDQVGIPTRNQLISGVFYVLMQECGYSLMQPSEYDDDNLNNIKGSDGLERRMMTFNLQRLLSQSSLIAPILKSPDGPYNIPLKLIGVQLYQFKLLISPSSDDLVIVNLLITNDNLNECFSIVLRVSAFVPNPRSENICEKFFDLRTLSVVFKDNIAHKGRSAVLNAEGLVNNSLVGLMDEVKYKIVKVLSVNDLLNLSVTCQSMLPIKSNQSIWKALLWRDFRYKFSEEEHPSLEQLIAAYRRLRTRSHNFNTLTEEVDDTLSEDDFNFDFGTESGRIGYSPSYDFHPYFIMNAHDEIRTTNTFPLPQQHHISATPFQQYNSRTHIQNHQLTESKEDNT